MDPVRPETGWWPRSSRVRVAAAVTWLVGGSWVIWLGVLGIPGVAAIDPSGVLTATYAVTHGAVAVALCVAGYHLARGRRVGGILAGVAGAVAALAQLAAGTIFTMQFAATVLVLGSVAVAWRELTDRVNHPPRSKPVPNA